MATQTERKDETRRRIVEAAAALFMEHGYEATSVDQIVARANVAKGTFYQHFETKIDVGVAIGRNELEEFYEATLKSVERGSDPLALLHRFLGRICEHFQRNPVLAETVLRHQMERALAGNPDNTGSTRHVVRTILAAAHERKLFRRAATPTDVADLITGAFMQATFTWAMESRRLGSAPPLKSRVRKYTDLILHGAIEQ